MQKTTSRGFTIIEVMIVLAIGGLIMLIVFQAIPTVTRNSRNSSRKHDVAAILEAVSHYELNNSGNFPPAPPDDADFLKYADLSYYDKTAHYNPDPASLPASGVLVYSASKAGDPAQVSPVTNIETVSIYKYQKCNTDSAGGSTGIGAGYYDVVALYAVQTSSGAASQCEKL